MTFGVLALICAVGLLGSLFSLPQRIAVPVVIGELAVGIALGVTGLGILDPAEPTFTMMAQIGFAMVMFVAGTHVPVRDPRLLAEVLPGLARALAIGLLALPIGYGLAHLFDLGGGALYAVVLASSSAALALPMLGRRRIEGRTGMSFLAQLAVADATAIVLLPLAVDPARAGRAAIGAAAILASALVCGIVLRRLIADGQQGRLQRISRKRKLAMEIRILLVLLFLMAALATFTHVSVMLAGFSLGVAVAAAGEPRRVGKQMFALTEGFFAPIFFVWVGATIDLRDLVEHPEAIALGLCLGVAALLIHLAPALAGQPWAAALATAGQLGVPIGAVALGQQAGTLDPGEGAALLLGALVTVTAVTLIAKPLAKAVTQRA